MITPGSTNQSGSGAVRRVNIGKFAAAALLGLTTLFASAHANAQSVRFRYTGGRWRHAPHRGWHRYWGGPSVGFYYAPSPVYVVPGYSSATYYSGPGYWYSDPAYGYRTGPVHYRHDRVTYPLNERRWHDDVRYRHTGDHR